MLGFMLSNYTGLATSGPITDTTGGIRADARALEHRVEALELACAGLWELLKFKLHCTDDELIAAVRAVDARDGMVDGKVTPAPARCPNCQRDSPVRRSPKCVWCGANLGKSPL